MNRKFIRSMKMLEQIDIEWPAVALFNYVCDITNNAEWRSEVVEAEWILRTEQRIGSIYREVRKINEEELELTFIETEYEPHCRRTITVDGCSSLTLLFNSVSDESTRVSIATDQEDGAMHLVQLYRNDLNRLKTLLEEILC